VPPASAANVNWATVGDALGATVVGAAVVGDEVGAAVVGDDVVGAVVGAAVVGDGVGERLSDLQKEQQAASKS